LLSDILINVLDKKICLLVELVLPFGLGLDDSEGETHESLVIHLSKAALSLALVDELKVAVAS
jgi:hypothetical protein